MLLLFNFLNIFYNGTNTSEVLLPLKRIPSTVEPGSCPGVPFWVQLCIPFIQLNCGIRAVSSCCTGTCSCPQTGHPRKRGRVAGQLIRETRGRFKKEEGKGAGGIKGKLTQREAGGSPWIMDVSCAARGWLGSEERTQEEEGLGLQLHPFPAGRTSEPRVVWQSLVRPRCCH